MALAFCSEPFTRVVLPDAPGSLDRPNTPFCLSGYKISGRHTCSDWEISSYKRDVEDYLEKLQEFANEAVAAANQTIRFANEAQDYAKCEADDVLDEVR